MSKIEPASNSTTASWITHEFLASVLRHNEQDASLSIVSSKVENAVPEGDNYVSVLKRVNIEYTIVNGTLPKSRTIIVKSLPLGEFMLTFVREVHVFDRELQMYAITLPALCMIVEEKTGDRYQIGPKYLETDRPDTIILEDLRPLGYKMANRREGLDFKHSLVAMLSIAKFHAASLALHEKDPESIEFYNEVNFTKEHRQIHSDFFEPSFTSLAAEVETWPGYDRFGNKVRRIVTESVDRVIEIRNRDSPLKVLNHGDFWTNNMLFRYDEEGEIVDLKLLDFQEIRYCSPALDITHFLYTSPRQSVLEEFEDELTEKYLEEINNTLKRLNCEHLSLTKDQLDREMKAVAYYAVFISMMFAIFVADPADAPKFDAITDENQLINTVMNNAWAGKNFRQTFERRLIKFEAQGLI